MWHRSEIQDGILRVTVNRQDRPVNALSKSSLEELRSLLQSIKADSGIRGVIFSSGKPGTFIAGADITEFEHLTSEAEARQVSEFGQSVFQELEDLPVPTVALISGACLGGGLEFALACTYRIADDHEKTRIGLPEVQLGLLPGWGGTVRLPRLIGLIDALPLILYGQQLSGYQARSRGIVQDVVPTEALPDVAEKILKTHIEHGSAKRLFRGSKKPGWRRWLERTRWIQNMALRKAQQMTLAKTHGQYPAPLAILKLLREGLTVSTREKFALESSGIAKLAGEPVTRECLRLFFLQESARKPPVDLTATFDPKELQQAAVIGAGAMGAGIALLFARKGVSTRLKDIKPEFVARGMTTVRELLRKDVEKKKLTALESTRALDRLSPTTEYRGLRNADVIIEAVVEDLEIKCRVFRDLAAVAGPETVLATNTSSLLVRDIAQAVPHPERVVGLHFFNPPHQMLLVEIIHTPETSPEALAKAFAAVQRLGKTPVVVGDCAGFLVNRLLAPYMNEAGFLLTEVTDPLEIDRAAVEFGMPMGPLALSDLVGLDVAAHVAENMHAAYGDRMQPALIWKRLKELRAASPGRPLKLLDSSARTLNPEIAAAVIELRREQGLRAARSLPRSTIIERLIFPIINEAARCLAEGIARNADDVDLAMVFGTGFAPFRGGPLRFATAHGLDRIVQTLDELAQSHPHLAPSDALRSAAATGGFHNLRPVTIHDGVAP